MRVGLRLLSLISALCILGSLLVVGNLWAAKYTTLVWEAESAKLSGKTFVVEKYGADPKGQKASGGKVLKVPKVKRGEKIERDSVTYQVKIPADGKYILWARTISGGKDSIGIRINDSKDMRHIGGDAICDVLLWRRLNDFNKPRFIDLKKGIAKITVVALYPGSAADELMLTTDSRKKPVGVYKPTPNLLKK